MGYWKRKQLGDAAYWTGGRVKKKPGRTDEDERHRNSVFFECYDYMTRRVRSTHSNFKTYAGLPICSWPCFRRWCDNEQFEPLWQAYVKSGFERKLRPTVDRIVEADGYVIGNMQWLSFVENCRKAAFTFNQSGKRKSKTGFIGVRQRGARFYASIRNPGLVHIGTFNTAEAAGKARDRWARMVYGDRAVLNFPKEEV